MSEESAAVETQADSSAATQSTEAATWDNSPIAQVYNPDGTPKEGALQAMENLGHGKYAKTMLRNGASIFDVGRQFHDSRSQLTKLQQQDGLRVPDENSTEEQVSAWREAVGALSSPDDYAKQVFPDDLPEDFPKDEALAKLVSDISHKHNVPASFVKELGASYLEHQVKQMEEIQKDQEAHAAEADKTIAEARQTLVQEFGGEQAFEKFSSNAKQFLTSPAAKAAGFNFEAVDTGDGKQALQSENQLHQAMVNDPAFIRLLKSAVKEHVPASFPSSQPSSQGSNLDNIKKASELIAKNPNGFKSSEDLAEYNRLVGISV